jgi:hypothetical protein
MIVNRGMVAEVLAKEKCDGQTAIQPANFQKLFSHLAPGQMDGHRNARILFAELSVTSDCAAISLFD